MPAVSTSTPTTSVQAASTTVNSNNKRAVSQQQSTEPQSKRSKPDSATPAASSPTSSVRQQAASTMNLDESHVARRNDASKEADLPFDAAGRQQTHTVTDSLLKAGAQTIHDLDKQFERKFITKVPLSSGANLTQVQSDTIVVDADGKIDEDALRQLRTTQPSDFLSHHWRLFISKRHPPRWEFHQARANGSTFGCTLHLYVPPKESRQFTVPRIYLSRTEAKDAVSLLAIQDGLPERAKAARSLAGDEINDAAKQGLKGDHMLTIENPVGTLHEACQKYAISMRPVYDFTIDRLTDLHGATVTCPISADIEKHYEVDPVYSSRKEAKDAVTRVALHQGIVELYEDHARTRTGAAFATGEVSMSTGKRASDLPPGVLKDAIEILNREAIAAFGSVKSLKWTIVPCPQPQEAAAEGSGFSPVLFSAIVEVNLGPGKRRIFNCDREYKDQNHARRAAASAAINSGILDDLREAGKLSGLGRAATGDTVNTGPLLQSIVNAGVLTSESIDRLPDPVSYLNLFLQKSTATTAPLKFEWLSHVGGFSCILLATIRGNVYKYESKSVHHSKKAAKEAAVLSALRQGVTNLVKPGSTIVGSTGDEGVPVAPSPAVAAPTPAVTPAAAAAPISASTSASAAVPASAAAAAVAAPRTTQVDSAHGSTLPTLRGSYVDYMDELNAKYGPQGVIPEYTVKLDPATRSYSATMHFATVKRKHTFSVPAQYTSRSTAQEAVARLVVERGFADSFKQDWEHLNPPEPRLALSEELVGPFTSRLVMFCETMFGDDVRRPMFQIVARNPQDGPFGATLKLNLTLTPSSDNNDKSNKVEYAASQTYSSPSDAVEAVARQAIEVGKIIEVIKRTVAREYAAADSATTESSTVISSTAQNATGPAFRSDASTSKLRTTDVPVQAQALPPPQMSSVDGQPTEQVLRTPITTSGTWNGTPIEARVSPARPTAASVYEDDNVAQVQVQESPTAPSQQSSVMQSPKASVNQDQNTNGIEAVADEPSKEPSLAPVEATVADPIEIAPAAVAEVNENGAVDAKSAAVETHDDKQHDDATESGTTEANSNAIDNATNQPDSNAPGMPPQVVTLQEYCTDHELAQPQYWLAPASDPSAQPIHVIDIETARNESGLTTEIYPKVWMTIGQTKFELPPPKKQNPKSRELNFVLDKLATKVLSYIKSGKVTVASAVSVDDKDTTTDSAQV
ncbi:hypothetical protein OIO90_003961 [Microbotryomycetes sp. JL221]|nr:hypothetical protein OIO90_003961 [Microbotryomycetes sp. JL221]